MKDEKRNSDIVAIVRLKERIPGHRASMQNDYSMIKNLYEEHAREQIIKDWVEKKIKETYVHIEEGWDGCDFTYEGWIKQ